MSTVTPKLNLVKPTTVEQFSLATLNNNMDIIDSNASSVATSIKAALKLIGASGTGATWGTPPTATSDIKVNIGSAPFTTDASGYIGVDMATAFPNGYIVFALTNGDHAAAANIIFSMSTGIFTNTATRFYIRALVANTGAAYGSGGCRVNYIAIGW